MQINSNKLPESCCIVGPNSDPEITLSRNVPVGIGLHENQAFTLVEVLAALVLAAVVLPVAMKGISISMAAADMSRQRLEAASLAESKLTEIVATGEWQSGELSGDWEDDWPEYQWQAQTEEWEENLRKLEVRVYWDKAGHQHDVVLTTLVAQESEE